MNFLIVAVTTTLANMKEKGEKVEMIPSLTQAGWPIGGNLVSLGANALEAALCVDTLASTAQQGVPVALVDVWDTDIHVSIFTLSFPSSLHIQSQRSD